MRRILLSLLAISRVWSRVQTGSEVDKGRRGFAGDSSERELFTLPAKLGCWRGGRVGLPLTERGTIAGLGLGRGLSWLLVGLPSSCPRAGARPFFRRGSWRSERKKNEVWASGRHSQSVCFSPQVPPARTPSSPRCSGRPVNSVLPATMNSGGRLCGTWAIPSSSSRSTSPRTTSSWTFL